MSAHLVALPQLTDEFIQTRLCGTPFTTPAVRCSLWCDDDTGVQALITVNHTDTTRKITLPASVAGWKVFSTDEKLDACEAYELAPHRVQIFVQL